MKNAERPTTKPSLQSKAPRQTSQDEPLENCPLCMEPIQPKDLVCHVRLADSMEYVPAHTACQDKLTAERRQIADAQPKKFIG